MILLLAYQIPLCCFPHCGVSKVEVTGLVPLEIRPINVTVFHSYRIYPKPASAHWPNRGQASEQGGIGANESFQLGKIILDIECHHIMLRVIASVD